MSLASRGRQFISHRLVQQTVVLQVGSGVGTVVQAASGVVLARLLAPALFGQYSLAFAVASIVTIFLGAGVQDAITPQVSRAWATGDTSALRQALGFFAKFTAANLVATVVVVLFLPTITTHLYHTGVIGRYAGIVAVASLVSTTVFTLAQLVLQIAGRIRTLSLLTLADVVARYGTMLAFLALGWGVVGAVSGHLVGAGVILVVSVLTYRQLTRAYPTLPTLGQLVGLVWATRWRPLIGPTAWVMLDRNLGMLYGALPVALVGLYAAGTEVAYFKLAFGYLMLAMTALGPISILMNVHFPTVQATDRDNLRRDFFRVTLWATLLSTGVTLVGILLAPLVIRILYGAVYLPALPYVYGFGIFGALFGLGVGLGPMWRALGRVQVSIVINLVTLGLGIPLGILLITHWHLWGAVLMVTLWYTISHLISFVYLLRALKSPNQ